MVLRFFVVAPLVSGYESHHKRLAIKIKAPSRRVASMPLDLYLAYNYA
jgi:hypothetical protein